MLLSMLKVLVIGYFAIKIEACSKQKQKVIPSHPTQQMVRFVTAWKSIMRVDQTLVNKLLSKQ